MRLLPGFVVLVLLVSPVPASALVTITECGTEIPPGETGVLANNLDCSSSTGFCLECGETGCGVGTQVCVAQSDCSAPNQAGCRHEPGVWIRKNATLDMQGHSIDSGPNCQAVACDARAKCTIISSTARGLVTGANCIKLAHKTKLTVSDIDVYRCGGTGIDSADISARVTATSVVARENGGSGIRAAEIRGTSLYATGNAFRGLSAENGKLQGSHIEVKFNGDFGAISSKPFKLDAFVASNNGETTSVGSGGGLWAYRGGKMSNSAVSGNTYNDESGELPMDILSGGRLRFTNVDCSRSGGNGGLLNGWGVCAGD